MKKTPYGCIGLESKSGVMKSYRSTTTSSVIITAPKAISVHTSAAYTVTRGPKVNWKKKAIAHIRAKRQTGLLIIEAIATPTKENAIPAWPIKNMVLRPNLCTK